MIVFVFSQLVDSHSSVAVYRTLEAFKSYAQRVDDDQLQLALADLAMDLSDDQPEATLCMYGVTFTLTRTEVQE